MAKGKLFVAPAGIARYPRLNQPDTKFDANGVFKVGLVYEADDAKAEELVNTLKDIRDEAFAQWQKENPKKKRTAILADVAQEETDDDGEPTGRIILNFKMRHRVYSKKHDKEYEFWPRIVDSRRKQLTNPPNIGGGSKLRVSFEANPYFNDSSKTFGLSLRIFGVQLLELVEFGGDAGFDDDVEYEGGYEGSEDQYKAAPRKAAEAHSDESDSEDESDDF